MDINFKGKKRKYKFTCDERQFILYETKVATEGKKKGETILSPVGYFSKIEHALEKVLHLEIIDADAHSFADLFAAITEAKEFIGTLALDNSKT